MKLNEGMIVAETCAIYEKNVNGLKNSSANNHNGQQYAFRARKQDNTGQSKHKLTTKRTYHASKQARENTYVQVTISLDCYDKVA